MIKHFCDCCNREITAAEASQTQLVASELIKGVQVEVTANVKVDKNRHVCAVCVSGVLQQLRPVSRLSPALPGSAVLDGDKE